MTPQPLGSPQATPPSPERFVGEVRRHLVARDRSAGLARWGAVVAGGTLALLMIASSGFGGRSLGLAGLAAAVISAVVVARRARERWADDAPVARYVGRRLPALGDDLLSALELERELPELDRDPRTSPQLVRALRSSVSARIEGAEARALVDRRRMRRQAARELGAAALVWAVALLAFPHLLVRGARALVQRGGETAATSAEPIVADVTLTLTYPKYTQLPPRTIAGTSGQVLALPGTEVRVQARALVPARKATLVLERDGAEHGWGSEQSERGTHPRAGAIEVAVSDGRLDARFVAQAAGRYRFVIEGGARRVREPEAHRIDLEIDHPPRVDLYAPAETLEVPGPRRVELAYALDDDYGLGELQLVWKVGNAPEQRKLVRPAPKPEAGERAASGKFEWDLGELDLKPGVRVAYHLEGKDNDDVTGPNVGVSRTYYLALFSPRERQEQLVAEQAQLLELALTQLADRLEVKRATDDELADGIGRAHGNGEALLAALGKTEQGLQTTQKSGPRSGEALKRELRDMHARIAKLAHDEETVLGDVREKRHKGPLAKGQAKPLDAVNARLVTELERDTLLLDDLLGKQRLEELLRVGDEMAQARDRLKQLMAEYKKTHSEAVKKEIERELRDLERKLAELREKASKLASELPDQFLNAEAMGKNDMQSQVDKMRQLLDKGSIDEAMAELERMSKELDGMMASMEQDLKGFREERFSAEEKAMAELEDKVTELQHDEEQLKSETGEVQKRTKAEAQKQLRERVQPVVKKAREQVAQLKKQVGDVDARALSPYDQEELQRVKQRIDDLDRMLQATDLDEAHGMARQAQQGLEGIDADLKDEEARAWRPPRSGARKTREHVSDGKQTAKQIADELEQALPKPGELMSPEDQKKMGQLGERQQAVRKRAQELQRELRGKTGPDGRPLTLPPQLDEGLRQAGNHMDRAEGELRQRDPRDAEGEEQQATEQLSKLREQLREQRRPREQMQGREVDRQPIKIPGAEEFKAPKEFRQDILDAMKRGAPPAYKEQVKRYYEELVK